MQDASPDRSQPDAVALRGTNQSGMRDHSERLVLSLDGKAAWQGPSGEKSRSLMERTKKGLDRYFQMELMSSEIGVGMDEKGRVLRVGQGAIVRESELPAGMDSLDVLSENLKKALIEAQRVHPMGHYLL